MNFKYFLPALYVGIVYGDLPIESAGAQKRFIEDIGAVCSRHNYYAFVFTEAVHLNEQLIKRLLSLVMPAAEARTALTAYRVYLIYKHDGGSVFLRLVEQIANTRSAHTYVHFNKIRAGNREERNVRLARHRAGKQCFTRSRRANKQNALGNSGAQLVKLLGVLKEFDDLRHFLFFLIGAGNVGKSGLFPVIRPFCLRFAESHRFIGAHSGVHTAHHKYPEKHQRAD